MEYIIAIIVLIAFSALAYWKGNPVIFLLTAAISIMVGLYTPDALRALNHNFFGVGIGLAIIVYSFICMALAYGNMLIKREDKE